MALHVWLKNGTIARGAWAKDHDDGLRMQGETAKSYELATVISLPDAHHNSFLEYVHRGSAAPESEWKNY